MLRLSLLAAFLAVIAMTACASDQPQPEAAKSAAPGQAAPESVWSKGAMVSAANPHAVAAAASILRKGGHAVDAAIAAHAVLGLVEPQSSGIGGGAFLLVYSRERGSLTFLDGREAAPAAATADMFVSDGEVMGFLQAWQSGLSVGVPGAVALYKHAHDEYGRLPWAELFSPAISLAADGFEVSPRLAGFLEYVTRFTRLDDNPETAAYFYPGGEPLEAGQILKNPAYAHTLQRISEEGITAFYQGEIAEAIVAAAQAGPDGGRLTVDDLADYQVVERPAICGPFRSLTICSASPPSSGLTQIMIPAIYDSLSAGADTQNEKITAFVDAQRLVYADRDRFIGDPDSITIEVQDLLDPKYLQHRASERFAPDALPQPGDPGLVLRGESSLSRVGEDATIEAAGTTHLSIIDHSGNAISMTATVEGIFGSSRWAHGFLLNNQMTDFSRKPPGDGEPAANVVAPGKRPRSSMSPTILFDQHGEILMVTGSPGGNSIPAYVAKSILGVLDWGLSAQEAVDQPNIIARGEKVRVEIATEDGQELAAQLQEQGYQVVEREGENSGLHVIVVHPDGLEGAADKRREGTVEHLP